MTQTKLRKQDLYVRLEIRTYKEYMDKLDKIRDAHRKGIDAPSRTITIHRLIDEEYQRLVKNKGILLPK